MSLAYGDTSSSLKNRKGLLNSLGIDERALVCARQIHGTNIKYAQSADKGSGALNYDTAIADTDALVTDEKNLPLAVFTADCLSVFLYDCKRKAIGLAHAGWRSTKDSIVPKAINFMQQLFQTEPADLYVGFGPAIRSCCYEVGVDFKHGFNFGLIERQNKYFLDLIAVNRRQVQDAGVAPEHIFDCGECTSCRSKEFFSFRREGARSGRMMSVLMLK
jgi:YfiH family protein